jgi:hypothetical protein
VREYAPLADFVSPGFFPEHAIETCVECAVDLEERVEVIVTETAVGFSTAVRDHEEELERELGGRHRQNCDGDNSDGENLFDYSRGGARGLFK